MKLFEILKTVLLILKTVLQSLKQCFKFGGDVQNHKTDLAGDDGLRLSEEIKTDISGDDGLMLLPEEKKTDTAGDDGLHLPEETKTDIAGDDGLHLPEEIIQRIQSFLNRKEAAQTTLVSKLWRSAWSTHPSLDFDEGHFQWSNEVSNLQAVEQLLQFAKKTMQGYDDLNLNIETFRLHIKNKLFREEKRDSRYLSLATELFEKAMKLGTVGLDFSLWNENFVLPDSVLRSETLARLSLRGFFEFDFKRLTHSKVKSLTLSLVHVDAETLSDSDEFPNLEYMYLCFFIAKGSLLNGASFFSRFSSLKELVFSDCFDLRNIRICSESLERITMITSSNRDGSAEFDVPNLRRFKFKGGGWTRLAFKATCREWESDVCLFCYDTYIGVDWFINLNRLLTDLSMSRSVSLYIYFVGKKPTEWCPGLVGTADLPTPRVLKELKLDLHEVTDTFLDNFFLICRPKLIILEKYRSGCELIAKSLWELSCKGIVEEVKVEVWKRASHEWRCVPLNHISNEVDDNSKGLMFVNALQTFRFKTLRFQLIWGILEQPKCQS